MWEPRRLTALWASTACYRESLYGKVYNKNHSCLAVLQMLSCLTVDADNVMIGTSIFIFPGISHGNSEPQQDFLQNVALRRIFETLVRFVTASVP
jgi:hypothetical protein